MEPAEGGGNRLKEIKVFAAKEKAQRKPQAPNS